LSALRRRLTRLQADALRLQANNLGSFALEEEQGLFRPRAYPWMAERHWVRGDELLARLNGEMADAAPEEEGEGGGARCYVARYAFGKKVDLEGGKDSSEVFGVFASRDLEHDGVLFVDTTRTWGCNGAGEDGDRGNLHGGMGCTDRGHCYFPPEEGDESQRQDLRWIRDRAGSNAADVLVRCRFLLCCIADDDGKKEKTHPLDHHLLARLTPAYHHTDPRPFILDSDIAIPNELLQRSGVDLFADPRFDTWVLFTLQARVENNSWSESSLYHPPCLQSKIQWAKAKSQT